MASTTKLASLACQQASLLLSRRCASFSGTGSLSSSAQTAPNYSTTTTTTPTLRASRAVLLGKHVSQALNNGEPVVALESTLLTHGLPQPQNLEVGLALEARVRAGGAVPATVAVLEGRFIVGLNEEELRFLADVGHSKPIKASRRDLAVAAGLRLNAGTTVAATLAIAGAISSEGRASGAGSRIKVFATGGTGGVHVGGESSMDISADLEELARSPMGLVSAGFKSFLDARRSLEYLETRGCPVLSLNPYLGHFPAFFARYNPKDPLKSPHNVTSVAEAARILFECLEGQLGSGSSSTTGLLLAVPIPEQWSLGEPGEEQFWLELERVTRQVELNTAEGRRKTPLILEQLNQATGGRSLEANRALLENNASVGAQLALEYELLAASKVGRLSKLPVVGLQGQLHQFGPQKENNNNNKLSNGSAPMDSIDAASGSSSGDYSSESQHGSKGCSWMRQPAPSEAGGPTVVGCTMIDLHVATRVDSRFKSNPPNSGITFPGKPRLTLGGVGRNLATGLALLGQEPVFLSSLARDNLGEFALAELAKTGLSRGGSLRLAWHEPSTTQLKHPNQQQQQEEAAAYSSCFALVLMDSIGGQCEYVIADLEACQAISRSHIEDNLEQISSSPLLVMDANLQSETMDCLISIATAHRVPIFLEPTDASLQERIVGCLRGERAREAPLLCMSPNLVELKQMVAQFEAGGCGAVINGRQGRRASEPEANDQNQADAEEQEEEEMSLGQVERLTEQLMRVHLPQLRCLLVTMDRRGVLVALRSAGQGGSRDIDDVELMQLGAPATLHEEKQALLMKHFQVPRLIEAPISGSGAGDSLAAGFISGLLSGSNVATCMQLGFRAAELALQSRDTIPGTLSSLAVRRPNSPTTTTTTTRQ